MEGLKIFLELTKVQRNLVISATPLIRSPHESVRIFGARLWLDKWGSTVQEAISESVLCLCFKTSPGAQPFI